MAKLYVLSDQHIKNGTRPSTPKQRFKKIIRVLSVALVLETIILAYLLMRFYGLK